MQTRTNPRKRTIWEAAGDDDVSTEVLRVQKAVRTVKKEALKAIPIQVPPNGPGTNEIKAQIESSLPNFEPIYQHRYKPAIYKRSTLEFDSVRLFLTDQILDILVQNTNSYAANHREQAVITSSARPWTPVTRRDLVRFLGLQLYMGQHITADRSSYWRPPHCLGTTMARDRFAQIFRYFTIRDASISPQRANEDARTWRLEPVLSIIRRLFISQTIPSSYVVVDESIQLFKGHSIHTTKCPGKPVDEGYKYWVLACGGYVITFLFHSGTNGPEGTKKTGGNVQTTIGIEHLPPTKLVVLRMAQYLIATWGHLPQRFLCFMDNLFLDGVLARALLHIGVLCCGTTRKNCKDFPAALLAIKNANQILVWDSYTAVVDHGVLYAVWQDNNAVLLTTTAFRPTERVQRLRKCPRITSKNKRLLTPVFGGQTEKLLYIPAAIDAYNHHMNGVDVANQLRKNLSSHRPQLYRTWVPDWYYIWDTLVNNAYLSWRHYHERTDHKDHRKFGQNLIDQMRNWDELQPLPQHQSQPQHQPQPPKYLYHSVAHQEKRSYCQYRECPAKVVREFGTPIVNGTRIRSARTKSYCEACKMYLCTQGSCWTKQHSNIAIYT